MIFFCISISFGVCHYIGVWVGWLFVFGVLYIYIYRDTLVVLGLVVCCFLFLFFTRGAVIIGLYRHHHEVLFCFCFFFFIVGVLERHFGGLGGFLSLLQFLL